MNWQKLLNYICDQSVPADELAVKAWLKNNKSHRMLFRLLQKRKREIKLNLPSAEVDKRWRLLASRLSDHQHILPARTKYFYYTTGIAALLLIGLFITFLRFTHSGEQQFVISAPAEKNIKLVLPDKSVVYLGNGSTISYDKEFNVDRREVKLKGYAFFEVAHNRRKTFIISTENNARVAVWGTSFSVNTCKTVGDNVEVASGKVSVSYGNQAIFLLPGEALNISGPGRSFARYPVLIEDAEALKNNRLIFRNEAIGSIAKRLSLRYGVKVQYLPSAENTQRFSGEVKDAGIRAVASGVAFSLGIKLKFTNSDHLIFY